MAIAAKIRARLYRSEIEKRIAKYSLPFSKTERLDLQLRLWNAQWRQIATEVPYWNDLQARGKLPIQFSSWEEFFAKVPVMTRADVRRDVARMSSTRSKPEFYRTTGGTTSQPLQMPAWHNERRITLANRWMALSWYGITPASRLFWIWGHAHLLGIGAKKWINGRVRMLKDELLGYYRFSAYDLQPQALRQAAEKMLRHRPEYIMGYSVALDMFARANLPLRDQLRRLGIKVVIATAEGFPAPDSADLIREVLGCEVAMEYGAVETDAIAHTHPDGGYRIFWQNYFIEAEKEDGDEQFKIRVTSLYPRCFPLVRYELGDQIEALHLSDRSLIFGLADFNKVLGRCNAYVTLGDGTRVHSEAFSHVLRGHHDIEGFQVVQEGSEIKILVRSQMPLREATENEIRATLRRVHPKLEHTSIHRVDELRRTIAGKTPMVVHEESRSAST